MLFGTIFVKRTAIIRSKKSIEIVSLGFRFATSFTEPHTLAPTHTEIWCQTRGIWFRKRLVCGVRGLFSQRLSGSPVGWKWRLRLWKPMSRQRGRSWLAQNTAFLRVGKTGAGGRLDGRRPVSKTGEVAKSNVQYQMSFHPTPRPIRNTHCCFKRSFCLVLLTFWD